MKRKLVKQGAATMMISLPSKWIQANKLGKGDEINLENITNKLVISSEKGDKEKKDTTIEITKDNEKDIKTILTHLYREGFDRIILKHTNSELIKQIRVLTSSILLGFEITSKTLKECTIENISEPTDRKYDSILQRVFSIIKETQETIENDFNSGKLQSMQDIQEIRDQQDRFILFCRRLLTKESYGKDLMLKWELLTFLNHINHAYYYLYKYTYDKKIKPDTKTKEFLKELKDYFDLYNKAYEEKKIEYIHQINSKKNELHFGEILKTLEKSKSNQVIYSYLREISRLIQIGSSPILSYILSEKLIK